MGDRLIFPLSVPLFPGIGEDDFSEAEALLSPYLSRYPKVRDKLDELWEAQPLYLLVFVYLYL